MPRVGLRGYLAPGTPTTGDRGLAYARCETARDPFITSDEPVSAPVRSSHSGPVSGRDPADRSGLEVTGADNLVDGWRTAAALSLQRTSAGDRPTTLRTRTPRDWIRPKSTWPSKRERRSASSDRGAIQRAVDAAAAGGAATPPANGDSGHTRTACRDRASRRRHRSCPGHQVEYLTCCAMVITPLETEDSE
jgi:hypothetical protein